MKHSDIALLMKGAAPVLREYLVEAVKPLEKRIAELEAQIASIPAGRDGKDGADGARGEKGESGADGKDGAPGATGRGIAKLLIDAKGHLVVTYSDGATEDVGLIVGKDGAPGKDGRDGADGVQGPAGADGAPGRDGANGQDGKSVEIEAVAELVRAEVEKAGIASLVQKAVDAIPAPRDGIDGKDGARGEKGDPGEPGLPGKDGANGRDGEKGADGKDGADGVGLADAVIDRDGNLVLTMTDGRHKSLGLVLGKDGERGPQGERGEPGLVGEKGATGDVGPVGEKGDPGKDGSDGLGFDDLTLDYDGERTVTFRFQKGDVLKEYPLEFPIVLDKGVWQERGIDGAGYKKGDGVSWGGSFYIARKDTFAKPDDFESWRLSVKRGRDGKEAVNLK